MNVILERNASGSTTTASYTRNPLAPGGIGGIISNGSNYYHYDGIGTVTALTNATGAIVNTYISDAFGNVLSHTGTTVNTRNFLTKESSSTGLVYFGARYYDPRIGRFISADPSGMSDGPNLYVYAKNDPVNYFDLWGLCKTKKKEPCPDWFKPFVPGYEDYGGPIRTDPTFQRPPKDSMDRVYMKHDINWLTGRIISADKTVYADLYNLPANPANWSEPPANPVGATFYRRFVAEPYFWWRSFFLRREDD